MFCAKKIFLIIPLIILTVSILIGYYQKISNENKVKTVIKWADENKIIIDKSKLKSEPFKIKFDENEWNFLVHKLNSTRYFDTLTDTNRFEYGFDPEYSKELVDYWKTKFDWKEKVNYLNKYPQFRITINDTIIHYLHFVTNDNKNLKKVPLLLLDGWPGSFFGFYNMIDYINNNYKDTSYNIIVPSIPGYGYSTPLTKPIDLIDTSFLFDALMRYEHGENTNYIVHGEDWGSFIATSLAQLFPSRVKGIHITMPVVSEFSNLKIFFYSIVTQIFPSIMLTPNEIKLNISSRFALKSRLLTALKEFGYMHLQATKPDTVGHGLTDSPVGLLAYVLEKYSSWSFDFSEEIKGNRDGALERFRRDDLLTIVTIYWMTNSITSSIRFYALAIPIIFNLNQQKLDLFAIETPKQVPIGVQCFINEIFIIPENIVKLKYTNLTRYNLIQNGGHFAAFQNPQLTAQDLIDFSNSI